MWPFGGRKNNSSWSTGSGKPVENPHLQRAFNRHMEVRSNDSALELGQALNSSEYLVPILADEMRTTPSETGVVTIQAGSLIKFMNCTNESGEVFLPAFTDWSELHKWAGPDASAFVMPASDLWKFALDRKSYEGVAVNPATIGWTLRTPNIQALIHDAKDT